LASISETATLKSINVQLDDLYRKSANLNQQLSKINRKIIKLKQERKNLNGI
jgi:uncharacterized protein YhaN